MRAPLDGLQLQMQLVAERSGNNHIATTKLQHTAAQLDYTLQGLTARLDELADAGVGSGHAATQPHGGLPTAVKLEKPKPGSGQMEVSAVLDAFVYACKLYFQLKHVNLDT